ncbi:maleylpyruvate isomerase family mycothiol-dependent enzyme [Mycobacterium sp. Root135]|uniref:maleylpyruvate isomerase family mycothiol-dependent enzyme n=1 Tax=Mycobacterium sp. Root135 TaxID=1736457 RepID=UPI001F1BD88C|nr:maleylpyruvate isomerase family mycothiol-dependent enzyme [Mycobacterium sp. Root135]
MWPVVHAERARLVDDLRRLPAEAWTTPSSCAGWDVHDVLAHLVDSAATTRLGFARRMILARFDFDRDNATGIARRKCADPTETLDAMRTLIGSTRTPPANPSTRLVECFVHGEDIRRPLGVGSHYPVASVVDALRYQVNTTVNFGGGRERVDGLRLNGTDAGFEHGPSTGAEVRGRAVDLLVAVSGRAVPVAALTGAGAAVLLGATRAHP